MNMTPGNILSVPIYSTSGVIAMAGLFFIVPGGIFLLGALCLCWVADRIVSSKNHDHISTTIEEYEQHMTEADYRDDPDVRSNQQMWDDFYNDPLFTEVDDEKK